MSDSRPVNPGEQQRNLRENDIVATEVRQLEDGSFVADATDWNQIGHFNFRGKVAKGYEGKQILVQILSAGKYSAYAKPIDISGYIVQVALEAGSRFAWPVNEDYRVCVRLNEPSPVDGSADVRVTGVSDLIEGEIHAYETDPPEVGDQFQTHIDYGAGPHRIQSPNGRYEVQLDEDVLVTGNVEVEITKASYPMKGKIGSYRGNLPDIGYTFQAEAEHSSGPHQAAPPDGRYPIEINEDILVSGMVEIEIIEHGLPMRGVISSYCGNLPKIGHTFQTRVEYGSASHRISDPDGRYITEVDENIMVSGKVEIKIVDHGLPMRGTISSYCGNLPDIGHTFKTQAERGSGPHQIPASEDQYVTEVNEEILVSGDVEIEIVEHDLPMVGVINSYCGNLPKIGDCFQAKISDGSGPHRVLSPKEQYEIVLEGDLLISDEVEIEIIEYGLPMHGRVISYCGKLPKIGESFDVHLNHGPDKEVVRSPDGRHDLQINEYTLVSGPAVVELTEHGLPMKAQIKSYRNSVPTAGETIQVRVRAMQQTVESPTKSFRIELIEPAHTTGTAQIEITEVSDAIYGKIRRYESTKQDLNASRSPRKSSIVDNSPITGRKL